MKVLTAKVVDGHIDVPPGVLQEGETVTILVPEDEAGFRLTEEERAELEQALAEAKRGEFVDGWQLLEELEQA